MQLDVPTLLAQRVCCPCSIIDDFMLTRTTMPGICLGNWQPPGGQGGADLDGDSVQPGGQDAFDFDAGLQLGGQAGADCRPGQRQPGCLAAGPRQSRQMHPGRPASVKLVWGDILIWCFHGAILRA